MKIFKIEPALEHSITIREPLSFQANVLKNQIWYRGDPYELGQFFNAATVDSSTGSRFWAASYTSKVRKMHSGVPKMVVNKFTDILLGDLDKISINDGEEAVNALWEEMAKDNKFTKVLEKAIQGALSSGDGAFKFSYDSLVSKYPIIEFFSADRVEYVYKRGRLHEILYYTNYKQKEKEYRLQETYGKGYITYKLFDDRGKEVALSTLEETSNLIDVRFTGNFIMGVPLMFFESSKWEGRGEALLDSKTEMLDALDEDISQFMDGIRDARTQKYIPEDLLPRDPHTGQIVKGNDFDNKYIAIGSDHGENAKNEIQVVTPDILHDAYNAGFASFLDLCLMGVISPSTLGIDLKKTDNAEAQREKEKTTLYTRSKLVDVLNEVIPNVVEIVLKVNDTLNSKTPSEYEVSVTFGEYAAPSFNEVVEVVGTAKSYGIMSTEKAVDELYGDTMSVEEKAEEVARIKSENGTILEEPATRIDGLEDDEDIESTMLNGAQITAMLGVVAKVSAGELTRNAAISIITSTLGVSRENAEQFIEEQL